MNNAKVDYDKVFSRFSDTGGFAKTSVRRGLSSAQKVALNRRGNELFNSGEVEAARRIFEATGYSDGLSRVGDSYRAQNRFLDALRMYWMAPDRAKCEPLFERLAAIIRNLAREDEAISDE
ncbi:MAG: hypothetical protein FWE09_01185 [Treponema sp.]|nr:hypothetical protein [Treponema sp.]